MKQNIMQSAVVSFAMLANINLLAATSGSVSQERLADFKAARVVDDDTCVYLPLDESPVHEMTLANYAYGEKSKSAQLYVNTGTVGLASDAMPGDGLGKVRGSYQTRVEASDYGSLHFMTNATAMKSGSILIDDEDRSITGGSFTFECFVRFGEPQGDAVSYLFGEHSEVGQCFVGYLQGGKLTLRVTSALGQYDDLACTKNLEDDRWHQIAAVVDRTAGTTSFWVDYKLVKTVSRVPTVLPHANYSHAFMVGTAYRPTDAFQLNNGYIDNVRITGRALKPVEFLCCEKLPVILDASTLAWLAFEGRNYGIWPCQAYRQPTTTGGAYAISADTVGEFGVRTRELGVLREANTNSFSMTYGYGTNKMYWEEDQLTPLTMEALTIEFFVKSTKVEMYKNIVALEGKSAEDIDWKSLASVQGSGTEKNFRCMMNSTEKSNFGINIAFADDIQNPAYATDGSWHHIAVVISNVNGARVKIKGYYDYQEIGNSNETTGVILNNLTRLRYRIDGGAGCLLDEVRFSARALTPDQMLRRHSGGMVLLFR